MKESLELWIQNVYNLLFEVNPWLINDHSIVKFRFDCRIGKRLIDLEYSWKCTSIAKRHFLSCDKQMLDYDI